MTNSIRDFKNTEKKINDVLQLAKTCEYDSMHADQVRMLALRLFDDLQSMHGLGKTARFWLECASILHEIGWIQGRRGHHKASLRIILATPLLKFKNKERLIIGSVARYHRGALPNKKHDHFATLNSTERKEVAILSSLLRVADALDHSHQQLISDVKCKMKSKTITVQCKVKSKLNEETISFQEKSDLFQKIFNRTLILKWIIK
ncbi:MAG: HD domain-containing protein [Anaerolineaceae bacterium]|nr:HD domain-containing protein [Anaerolineaceae bacterium]